jgi:hypothetical protein
LVELYRKSFPGFLLPPLYHVPQPVRQRLLEALALEQPDLEFHREGVLAQESSRKDAPVKICF